MALKDIPTEEIAEKYNEYRLQGLNSIQAAEMLGYNWSAVKSKFRKAGYFYDKEANQYLKKEIRPVKSEEKNEEGLTDPSQIVDEETMRNSKQNFAVLLEKLDKLTAELSATKNKSDGEFGSMQTAIKIKPFDGPAVQCCIRLQKDINDKLEKIYTAYSYCSKYIVINSILEPVLDKILEELEKK